MVALASLSDAADAGAPLVDRVNRLLERVDYRLVESAADREAIFRLRYGAYLNEGAIAPDPSGLFSDALDDTDNAYIYGVYVDGELVSSIRLHVATARSPALPALNVFSDLLAPETAAGKVVIDPTRFVADRSASRRFPELCYATTRLAILGSEFFDADLLLATVRAEHQAFYGRVFGHKLVCAPRHYPSLTKPISLMALHYPTGRERVLRRYSFFRSSYFEQRMLFARPSRVAMRSAA